MKKKLFIILSAVLAIVMAVQFTAFAGEVDTEAAETAVSESEETVVEEGTGETSDAAETPEPYGVSVALYLMESNNEWSWPYGKWDKPDDWSEPASEPVYITEDGTYTLSLTDLQIPADTLMLCYIKDTEAYEQGNSYKRSNLPDDVMIITDVFKVNGSEKSVDSNVRTGLKGGLFDVCYRNNWADEDNHVVFTGVINSIEVTFTVTGITGEPGAIKYEPTQPPVEEKAEETAQTETQAPAEEKAEETAAADNEVKEESSGLADYLPIVIGAVIAVVVIVVIIVVVVKKKK